MPHRRLTLVALLMVSALAAGCGESEPEAADNAVEAQEQNAVVLDGIRYRVNLFRQLNPRLTPDQAIYEGGDLPEGTGVYAAFLQVCNAGGDRKTPTSRMVLEDAFGESFEQVRAASEFAYEPQPLDPDECLPPDDSAARRATEGAAVLFEVPFEALDDRPFVLELRAPGGDGEVRRIQLDL